MPTPLFELTNILKIEAAELASARQRAFTIHHTGDIDASGDEIEQKVREIIRRKTPMDYYIGHGHIVDESLNYNGQYDIVIADNSGSPILFTAENGTEYFPYESVYAVGEIKSTFYKSKKYIEAFINRTQKLYSDLSRKQTDQSYLTKDLKLNFGNGISFDPGDKRSHKNPILKLMFFVDKGDFKWEDIMDIYATTEDRFLPNVICILNKGIVVKVRISEGNSVDEFSLFPEFISTEDSQKFKWVFIELGKDIDISGAHLAFVFFAINQHLRNCIVLRPDLLKYFANLFKVINGFIIA